MKYLLAFLLVISIASCNSSQSINYKSIEYEVGPCFGFCPVYKIIIDTNQNAILEAEHFNFTEGGDRADYQKPREGTFRSKLTSEDFKNLMLLVDKANVKNLENSYKDKTIMDATTSYLRIKFKDQSPTKEVMISAGEKPENLNNLISYIEDIKKKLKWEKLN